jgi:hypothetical protein
MADLLTLKEDERQVIEACRKSPGKFGRGSRTIKALFWFGVAIYMLRLVVLAIRWVAEGQSPPGGRDILFLTGVAVCLWYIGWLENKIVQRMSLIIATLADAVERQNSAR